MDFSRREFLSTAGFLGLQLSPLLRLAHGSEGPEDDDSQPVSLKSKNPYLDSVYAPTSNEINVKDLEIEGKIPAEISGAYFRNGPNPPYPTNPHHWFDGDAMIHRIGIKDGRASYCNRYVQTQALSLEKKWGKIFPGLEESMEFRKGAWIVATALLLGGPAKDTSNTDLIYFKNKIISLWWLSGVPYALNPETLEPEGVARFEGYKGNVGAHARIDPRTGDLFFLDFSKIFGWVKVCAVKPDGTLNWVRKFKLPAPRVYHDVLFTENYVVLMGFPVGFQFSPKLGIGLNRKYPARIVLVPRDGKPPERVFEIDSCYVLHGLNAYEKGGTVFLSVTKYDDPFGPKKESERGIIPYVGVLRVKTKSVLWTMDLNSRSNKIKEEMLDDTNTEFPRINDHYLGIESRFSYHPRVAAGRTVKFNGLVKMDWKTGKTAALDLPENQCGEEFVFIPRPGGKSEDEGWLATFIHNEKEGTSRFEIFDAASLNPAPVASIRMPQRVPAGFHCKWVSQ